MNLEKALSAPYSQTAVRKIADYVGKDPQRFKFLIDQLLSQEKSKISLAAGGMSICVERHPLLLKAYVKKLTQAAAKNTATDSLKRNVLRALQFVRLSSVDQGIVADFCFQVLTNRKEAIAIRVFAMTVLGNIALEHPDLKQELALLLESEMPLGSPGYVSRAKKVLKQLQLPK
ncbi:MAG: hypothetical protein EBR30_16840 [Cytophagia bacterium]|nr:hypothetical protein [Cytophagia bacterium]NBW36651.1 hypothetical protein [Cytophagia bacterium]